MDGTEDASLAYAYDASGRLVTETYTYTGDGTPDRYEPLLGTDSFTYTYTYDADRTTGVSATYASGQQFDTVFEYDSAGLPTRSTTTSTHPTLGSSQVVTVFSFTGSLMTSLTLTAPGSSTPLNGTVSYDGNGRAVAATQQILSGSMVDAFTWNADDSIATWTLDVDGDGTVDTTRSYGYSGGLPSSFAEVHSGTYAGQPGYSVSISALTSGNRLRLSHDDGDNGSVDGVEQVQFEDAACSVTRLPIRFPLISVPVGMASSDAYRRTCLP